MPEVKVKEGEELNGLGTMLKEIMDTNLKDPKKYKSIEKLKGSMVIRESSLEFHFPFYHNPNNFVKRKDDENQKTLDRNWWI